ncbi:MAG: 16S rRNA (guanine(966)-N(2))-methyltransferase RsmD [Planctomycetes bacterium]|nr:16S rRNA (guanine(966)-N(2))-methyltransferase RsmD [Planctomycetota bacterium]
MRITGGQARGRKFKVPGGSSTRPPLVRLRQSVFSILGERVEGSRVLDLFAGAGAFGIEALSRGARQAVFVEREKKAAGLLARNLRSLRFRFQSRVLEADALAIDHQLSPAEAFDLIFVDPPFPLLLEPAGREAVLRLLKALFEKHLAPGGLLVFRYPEGLRGEPTMLRSERGPMALPAADFRVYGRSAVALFEKETAGQRFEGRRT